MTDNKHLIENITLTNGKVITLNIYCDNDEEFNRELSKIDSKYEYINIRVNHNSERKGDFAKAKNGSWVDLRKPYDEIKKELRAIAKEYKKPRIEKAMAEGKDASYYKVQLIIYAADSFRDERQIRIKINYDEFMNSNECKPFRDYIAANNGKISKHINQVKVIF